MIVAEPSVGENCLTTGRPPSGATFKGVGRDGAAFHARSLHYRVLAKDPALAACAAFFTAAHLVTYVLALSRTTDFIATLSRHLQAINDDCAQRVRAHKVRVCRNWRSNTACFVRFEQQHVQQAFDHLQSQSPAQSLQEILLMNRNIRRAGFWVARLVSPAHEALYRAIRITRSALRTWPDFGLQRHRELLGFHLSVTAMEGQPSGARATEQALRGRSARQAPYGTRAYLPDEPHARLCAQVDCSRGFAAGHTACGHDWRRGVACKLCLNRELPAWTFSLS